MNKIFTLLLVILLTSPAVAREYLPIEDSNINYLTVFAPENSELVSWFKTNPELISFKDNSHFNQFTFDDPVFQTRFAKAIGNKPSVLVQSPDGKVLFKASSFTSAKALAKAMSNCPWKCKPQPEPQPTPIDEIPDDLVIDDFEPLPDTIPEGLPPWVYAVIGLGGVALGGYNSLKAEK